MKIVDKGDGEGSFIIAREGSPVDVEPENLINYNCQYGASEMHPTKLEVEIMYFIKVLIHHSLTKCNIHNLLPNTTYYFALFEYNGI